VRAAIGVSAGDAVAGYIGDIRRYEYHGHRGPGERGGPAHRAGQERARRVLAAGSALGLASAGESTYWELGDAVTLRGRASPTRLPPR